MENPFVKAVVLFGIYRSATALATSFISCIARADLPATCQVGSVQLSFGVAPASVVMQLRDAAR